MVKQILIRVKTLLGIEDQSEDAKLIYMIESSILQVQNYIHSTVTEDLIPIVAQLACHLYSSGEGEGGGGGSATVGEVKKESYSGVSFEYTTSADFTSGSTSSDESSTYFSTIIAPMLQCRRKIQTVWHQL